VFAQARHSALPGFATFLHQGATAAVTSCMHCPPGESGGGETSGRAPENRREQMDVPSNGDTSIIAQESHIETIRLKSDRTALTSCRHDKPIAVYNTINDVIPQLRQKGARVIFDKLR
jgi:hypothetical protein